MRRGGRPQCRAGGRRSPSRAGAAAAPRSPCPSTWPTSRPSPASRGPPWSGSGGSTHGSTPPGSASWAASTRYRWREVRRLLDVNAVGALNGARAAVPVMRRQGGGVLADVASLLGAAVAAPYMGAYAMSKAALAAFDDVLRREPALQGESRIAVCTVLPTGVDTPFFRNAANHSRVPVGPYARSMAAAHALAPGLLRRGIARRTDRAYLDRGRPRLPQAGNLHTPTGARAALHGGRHGGARTAARRAAAAAAAVLAVRAALRGRPAPR
nr:SDR family NAD(P)-dependent oxidoreductase [Streptomyces globosus]